MRASSDRRRTEARPAAHKQLKDVIAPAPRVLFVGINPGLRSASLGHHFAGYSNRFWKLLHDSGLVPEPLTYEDDRRLPEWGYGLTNLVPRSTAGVGDLTWDELRRGRRALLRKIRTTRPRIVALVGITVFRAVCDGPATRSRAVLGDTGATLAGARVFVLPNPSGRNAHYRYDDMLAAYRALATFIVELNATDHRPA